MLKVGIYLEKENKIFRSLLGQVNTSHKKQTSSCISVIPHMILVKTLKDQILLHNSNRVQDSTKSSKNLVMI